MFYEMVISYRKVSQPVCRDTQVCHEKPPEKYTQFIKIHTV